MNNNEQTHQTREKKHGRLSTKNAETYYSLIISCEGKCENCQQLDVIMMSCRCGRACIRCKDYTLVGSVTMTIETSTNGATTTLSRMNISGYVGHVTS